MTTSRQTYLTTLHRLLISHAPPQSSEETYHLMAQVLRQTFGPIRTLFYRGLLPPHTEPASLFPCSARQRADDLFIRDEGRLNYACYLKAKWLYSAPLVAGSYRLGLLFIERPAPPLSDHDQMLLELIAAQTAHRLVHLEQSEWANGQDITSLLTIDTTRQQVRLKGQVISVRGKQLQLLHLLYQHRGCLCSREFLCHSLYTGAVLSPIERQACLDLLIHKLRRKLSRLEGNPIRIETVRGQGYRLRVLVRF